MREDESTLWLVYRGMMRVGTSEHASVQASSAEGAHVHQDVTCASIKEHILWYNGARDSIPHGITEQIKAYLAVQRSI